MERNIHTTKWALRLVSTVLGMIMVDAYNMYTMEFNEYHKADDIVTSPIDFRSFVLEVGTDLAKGVFWERPGNKRHINSVSSIPGVETNLCRLEHLNSHPSKKKCKGYVQSCCKICKKHASWYCSKCSSDVYAYTICGMGTNRNSACFAEHQSRLTLSVD